MGTATATTMRLIGLSDLGQPVSLEVFIADQFEDGFLDELTRRVIDVTEGSRTTAWSTSDLSHS